MLFVTLNNSMAVKTITIETLVYCVERASPRYEYIVRFTVSPNQLMT